MITAVIIDDEINNITNLQLLLQSYCTAVHIVGSATNAIDAVQLIVTKQPDLLFLDIQMPDKNGFDLLQELPSNLHFEVIFVTAYAEYGIKAIKWAALDYLLKPVVPKELITAVQKAIEKKQQQLQNLQLQSLLHYVQGQHNKANHRIALPSAKETRLVAPADILYCESMNNYTKFYLIQGEVLVISKPIYEYEELLTDYNFVRCHQSYLANINHVVSWVKEDGGYLLLSNKASLPVSRQKKDVVKQALMGR
ncbi:MAG TPA: DNA-binding response regulator [Chitinophagaceae bacterium]|nr:DNA-binding response regulator [Chitinophagaceae bacterium]HAN40155.1 DNA-binding response regulator [Chitinophagaceae bacterium]